jgi:hypothetical protein
MQEFINLLQTKLDEALTMGASAGTTPDAVSLQDAEDIIE